MKDALVAIGERICTRRKELNYTQEQLAEQMDVSIQMVSNLERGNKAIRIDNLIKLCEILKVSTDYILLGKRTDIEVDELFCKLRHLSPRDYRMISMIINCCAGDK